MSAKVFLKTVRKPLGVGDILKFQKIALYMSKMGTKHMAARKVCLSRFISATIGEWKLVFKQNKILTRKAIFMIEFMYENRSGHRLFAIKMVGRKEGG